MFLVALNIPWNIIVNFIYRNSILVCISANMLISNILWRKTTHLSLVFQQGFFKVFLLEKKLGSIVFRSLCKATEVFISFLRHWKRSHQRCSLKKCVLKNFVKFTGKHLCQSIFFNKIAGLGLWQWCFPTIFAKSLRTPFYRTPLDDCFWLDKFKCWNVLTPEWYS